MHKFFLIFFFILWSTEGHGQDCVLDFESAWERILSYSPTIAAADSEILARDAEKKQVSCLINPVAEVEGENLGISHPNRDTEPPQTTIVLSQMIELGGKRRARRSFAASQTTIAFWEAQIQRLKVRHVLTRAFIEVSLAQEKFALAKDKEVVASRIHETVRKQVEGGKASSIQLKKSIIEEMSAQLYLKEARSDFQLAKKRISSLWGEACPDFDYVTYDLFSYDSPPCESCLLKGIFQLPDFSKAKQEIFSASQNLRLQKANSIPDVTISGGYRYFNDSHQHGWLVGAAIPLPVFNQNRGNIERAQIEMNQAEYQLEELERELREKIFLSFELLTNSFEESECIRKGILADANEAYKLTQTGYQQGKLEFMDLLDAQKMLFEIREKYIEVLYEYHINLAELARLSGGFNCLCMEEIANSNKNETD